MTIKKSTSSQFVEHILNLSNECIWLCKHPFMLYYVNIYCIFLVRNYEFIEFRKMVECGKIKINHREITSNAAANFILPTCERKTCEHCARLRPEKFQSIVTYLSPRKSSSTQCVSNDVNQSNDACETSLTALLDGIDSLKDHFNSLTIGEIVAFSNFEKEPEKQFFSRFIRKSHFFYKNNTIKNDSGDCGDNVNSGRNDNNVDGGGEQETTYSFCKEDFVEFLINYTMKNWKNEYFLNNCETIYRYTPECVRLNNIDLMILIMEKYGNRASTPSKNVYYVREAIENGNLCMVKYLLEKKNIFLKHPSLLLNWVSFDTF